LMSDSGLEVDVYADGDKVHANSMSCQQTTDWIYRETKSTLGFKTTRILDMYKVW